MRLEFLEYAIEIAKTKSLSKASENLYLTKATLSESIKRLENDLGFKIFARTNYGMELTAVGEVFIDEAMEVCKKINSWSRFKEGNVPLGKINVLVSLASKDIFSAIIDDFCRKKPALPSLSITYLSASNALDYLKQNKAIAIFSLREEINKPEIIGFCKKKNWAMVHLFDDSIAVAVSGSYYKSADGEISYEQLKKVLDRLTMIIMSTCQTAFSDFLDNRDFSQKTRLYIPDIELILHMIKKGEAMSFLPLSVIKKHPELNYAIIEGKNNHLAHYLLYPKENNSVNESKLIEYLMEHIKKHTI